MGAPRLRPVEEQTLVITGASSGIGLATARMAARRGARVVLAARNERALQHACGDIEAIGGSAAYVVCDVANEQEVEHVADVAERRFGRIDTWVNNAASAVYATLGQLSIDDARRVFDVTFWGMVHGCQTAVPRLREHGGAIVNIGSATSDRAVPLQGMYSAAKHAVKAYTDTLRMELAHDRVPIAVSLVKPASIDTPFFTHARNYMDVEPKPMPPVYAPELVAEAILTCAARPTRHLYVGGAAATTALMNALAPRLTDRFMARAMWDGQRSRRPAAARAHDNLHAPLDSDGVERGNYRGTTLETSFYTQAAMHPRATLLAMAGLGLAVAAGVRMLGRDRVGEI